MQNYIKNLVTISKFAGERFDLVQAGGGNSSVKLPNGTMLIKASGVSLSELENNKGYTIIDNIKLTQIFQNNAINNAKTKVEKEFLAKQYVQQATITSDIKPSIETTLHTLLGTYVLHTHPIIVNAVTCRTDWKTILVKLFSHLNPLFINYKTPGIELAYEIYKILNECSKNQQQPFIFFLQNHGLIISSDSSEEIISLTNMITKTLEEYLLTDFHFFRFTNQLSTLINSLGNTTYIAYASTDSIISSFTTSYKKVLFAKPFCPDTLVYCGYKAVEITNDNKETVIQDYLTMHKEHPKVIVYNNTIYFIAPNIRKAKEIEDVFKFHLLSLQAVRSTITAATINFLPEEEQDYLAHWDAEQYRQVL